MSTQSQFYSKERARTQLENAELKKYASGPEIATFKDIMEEEWVKHTSLPTTVKEALDNISHVPFEQLRVYYETVDAPPSVSYARNLPSRTQIHQININEWYVESSNTNFRKGEGYVVRRLYAKQKSVNSYMYRWHCTCHDFRQRRLGSSYPYCKHIYGVYTHRVDVYATHWICYPEVSVVALMLVNTHGNSHITTLDRAATEMPEVITWCEICLDHTVSNLLTTKFKAWKHVYDTGS